MRLSDIKGERVFDVIADIIGPVANIVSSGTAASLWEKKPIPEGSDIKAELMLRIKNCIPELLRKNKSDLVTIMAAISGEERGEYLARLDMLSLMRDLTELLTDESFIGLFTSARSAASSGSVQENTPES